MPRLAAVAALAAALVALSTPRILAADEVPYSLNIWMPDRTGEDVRLAVGDALDRLEAPRCARMINDLLAVDGLPLSARLDETWLTPRQFLASLRFLDGSDDTRCHADAITVAFTQPGSRVIYVCSARFAAEFPRNTDGAAFSILHEYLHALGLGENPPSPSEITRFVKERCGD